MAVVVSSTSFVVVVAVESIWTNWLSIDDDADDNELLSCTVDKVLLVAGVIVFELKVE